MLTHHMQPRPVRLIAMGMFLLAVVSGAVAQNAPLPPALGLIPPDAPVAVIVPSLAGLSQKIARFNEETLDSAAPFMADVLGMFKSMTGTNMGLDDNGTLMVIVLSTEGLVPAPQPADGDAQPQHPRSEPPVVILAPMADYAGFVRSLGGNPFEAVSAMNTPMGGRLFSKKIGNYAVLADSQKSVEAYQPPAKPDPNALTPVVGKAGARCLASSDAAVIVNMNALEPVIRPHFETAMAQITAEIAREIEQQQPDQLFMKPFAAAFVNLYADALNALLRDTSAVMMGMDIASPGIGLSYVAQFEPGSPTAKMFTHQGDAAGLLARLGDQPYWLATSIDLRSIAMQTITETIRTRWPKAPEPANPQDPHSLENFMGSLGQIVNLYLDATLHTKGFAGAYLIPAQPGMMGGGLMNAVVLYETTNAQALLKAHQEYFQFMEKMMATANTIEQAQHAGPPDGQAPSQPQITVKYTPNSLQLEGIQIDEYQMQYHLTPEMTQEMGPAAPFFMMMTNGGNQAGYIAAKGQFVVMTTTRDAQLVQDTFAAAERGNGLGSAGPIAQVRKDGLPPNTVAEYYLSLPGIMGVMNPFLAMLGQMPMDVPQDLPPVAWGMSVEDHGVTSRLYVPAAVIRTGKDMVDQAMMNMGGQPGEDDQGMDDWQDEEFEGEDDSGQGPPPAPF